MTKGGKGRERSWREWEEGDRKSERKKDEKGWRERGRTSTQEVSERYILCHILTEDKGPLLGGQERLPRAPCSLASAPPGASA